MQVKAKFKCVSVMHTEYDKIVNLTAICGTKGENADFTKYTPSGNLQMNVSKDAPAAEVFVPGEEYYLYFEKVAADTVAS